MVDDKLSPNGGKKTRRRKPCTIVNGRKYVRSYTIVLVGVDHRESPCIHTHTHTYTYERDGKRRMVKFWH
jgi:hypothetical protein